MSTEEQINLASAIVEQVADAIIFADPQGAIRIWNAGAAAIFGYPADEALGQSLDLIIPERLRAAHWAAFDKALETGQTKYGRQAMTTRSAKKDGSKLYVDLSFALVKDQSGRVLGAVAMARDVTSRQVADSELRKRLAELEQSVKASPTTPDHKT
jgi:PAS domain S-box-containing protein